VLAIYSTQLFYPFLAMFLLYHLDVD